jgi:hypothetical protein
MHVGGPYYCDMHKPQPSVQIGGWPLSTWYDPKEHCRDHCYCQGEDVIGKKHVKCCMCGHRKLAKRR